VLWRLRAQHSALLHLVTHCTCFSAKNFFQVLHEQLDVAQHPGTNGSSSHPARQQPTVLQIAHELTAIIEYDAVMVMAAGRVVESGNPQQLAAQQSSKFANLLAQAGHHHHGGGSAALRAGSSIKV
jgi:hypothetical protein